MIIVVIIELLKWVELQTPQLQKYCNCYLGLVEKGVSPRFFPSHQAIRGLLERQFGPGPQQTQSITSEQRSC